MSLTAVLQLLFIDLDDFHRNASLSTEAVGFNLRSPDDQQWRRVVNREREFF